MKQNFTLFLIVISLAACKKSNNEAKALKISLLSPLNSSTISAESALEFSWRAPVSTSSERDIYKIKIVEITGDQSPEDALRGNKPHFEKDSLKESIYTYPNSAARLKSGSKYSWGITARRDGKPIGENSGTSEASKFTVSGGSAGGATGAR